MDRRIGLALAALVLAGCAALENSWHACDAPRIHGFDKERDAACLRVALRRQES